MSNNEGVSGGNVTFPGAGPSVTDIEGFDRGTGTGEPTESVGRLLRLMKGADDAFNAQDYTFFMEHRHDPGVVVHQLGAPDTVGLEPHRRAIKLMFESFPNMRVHNDPYDVQFGQGEWLVAMGKLSGTFTRPMTLPDQTVIQPTGKSFTAFFATIARWQNDKMVEEYVVFDQQDMMRQVGIMP